MQYEFQTEARQILDLMIHSVYSNKDIFLRELISNASDALDKRRIEALTNPALKIDGEASIEIEADKEANTLTLSDNGVGMSADDLVTFLGTIAKSGTKEYLEALKSAKNTANQDLIGQFGVGFYASFMVADKVTVISKKAGETEASRWESTGDGTYSIEPAEREQAGTTVILHLKPQENDEGSDYTNAWTLRQIVKKYSDFVPYPIRLIEKDDKDKEEREEEKENTPINSMKALWLRPESEVSEEEYDEFYRHISHDWNPPLKRICYSAEGTSEFRALLYIPETAPHDIFMPDSKHGIQLYIRRVFIMSDCKELIPEYLRFLKGVVDSEDLPLNVSREILQQDRQTAMIRSSLIRKTLETLKGLKNQDRPAYEKFWGSFGQLLKEGMLSDFKHKKDILDLCLFRSNQGEELVSLADYIAKAKEEQKAIYYLTGDKLESLSHSPKIELFSKNNIQVLLLTDPIDQLWVQSAGEYADKPFVSVSAEDLRSEDLPGGEKADPTDAEWPFAQELASLLGDSVEAVRPSARLVDSPACFVTKGESASPQLRRILKSMGQPLPEEKRILEVNREHPLVQRAEKLAQEGDSEQMNAMGQLLLDMAWIAEGELPPDPAALSRRITQLLQS